MTNLSGLSRLESGPGDPQAESAQAGHPRPCAEAEEELRDGGAGEGGRAAQAEDSLQDEGARRGGRAAHTSGEKEKNPQGQGGGRAALRVKEKPTQNIIEPEDSEEDI